VSLVFQSFHLLPNMTAEENIAAPLEIAGILNAFEVADAWLKLVGLSARAKHYPHQLSGGEQQRVALARALARQPEILLLDEPTASLDPAATLHVEEIIRMAAQSGTKIVMASHDLGQVRRLAGDVVFMVRGRVCEQVAAEDFFDRPSTPEAAAFIRGDLVL
jgi:tungstate transport system ATP-binding protein